MSNLKKLAAGRINELTEEISLSLFENSKDMGVWSDRHSGFGKVHSLLVEIKKWTRALEDSL